MTPPCPRGARTRLALRGLHAFAIAALFASSACRPKGGETDKKPESVAPAPVKVETAHVTIEKMPRYLGLNGSVQADRSSEVAANVAGRVISTYVERGQPVKASQVLATVDSKGAALQALSASAQSKAAETQEGLAKQECDRADALFAQAAISKAEFDRLKTQCQAQLFTASAARANADLAQKLAGDTVIRAPIDGIVGERYVNVGEYVQPATKVASVFAVNPARVSISVPEFAVAKVSVGQTLDVQVSAWPDRTFPAVVRFVSPSLRNATRDLIIEASAPNAEKALLPGMFATVKLTVGEADLPTVPESAVKTDGTTHRIWLARKGQAYEMVVQVGVTKNGRTAVMEPLSTEELVIVKPPPGLRDGSAIQ